jgi:hypothetical protein
MNNAAQRQLAIATRKGLVTTPIETFEQITAAREAIIRFNLPHLLMGLNGKLEALGAQYIQGEWVI